MVPGSTWDYQYWLLGRKRILSRGLTWEERVTWEKRGEGTRGGGAEVRLRQPDKMPQAQTRGTSCASADVLLSSSHSPSPHTQSAPAASLLTLPRRALPQGLCMH